ncbi:MAG: hypothetical protein HZA94_00600 [Candidatus Vogelbacteria bacterium]|nr:hypothetical protein [Candidatus Vogelbacteria bacterium]
MDSIREVLGVRDGIFAITPRGAKELWKRRLEINLSIILLRIESEAVLRRNLVGRGITDPAEQEKLCERASEFVVPADVPYRVVKLNGNVRTDRRRLISALYPKS